MIYLDHNATTPLWPEVARLLTLAIENQRSQPGNASSVHQAGRQARAQLDGARARVAASLGCEPREVCFTGSGSESDALALKGAFAARKDLARRRIVTSQIEHPAVLGAVAELVRGGAEAVQVAPGADGAVSAEAMLEQLNPATALCSLMWANNETGVLQPVAEVARACRDRGILFHTDAVQAVGKVPVSLRGLDADLVSFSAHKFGGPLGSGALIVRRGVELRSLVAGHQEDGRRGGTAHPAAAEALALALELSIDRLASSSNAVARRRDRLERGLVERLKGVRVNGGGAARVPNTTNLCFEGADGEGLLIGLDLEGICVSSGAACASGALSPSHVLRAMGLTAAQAHASLRVSFGTGTTDAEVERVLEALCTLVPRST